MAKSKKHKTKLSSSKAATATVKESPVLPQLPGTLFKILPITTYLKVATNKSSIETKDVTHFCFFKKHETRPRPGSTDNSIHNQNSDQKGETLPLDKTLFVTNLPVDATETHLEELFKECGAVDKVVFRTADENLSETNPVSNSNEDAKETTNATKKKKKRKQQEKNTNEPDSQNESHDRSSHLRVLLTPGSSAYIIFKDAEALEKALNMRSKKRIWATTEDSVPPLGLESYIKTEISLRSPLHLLQTQVDSFMSAFNESELARRRELEAKHNKPDEDGFILVTRYGKRNTNTDGNITVSAMREEEARELKPKKKELQDFYRFQLRETKRNKLIELRKKFEEDKKKIELLKATRRFRPY